MLLGIALPGRKTQPVPLTKQDHLKCILFTGVQDTR